MYRKVNVINVVAHSLTFLPVASVNQNSRNIMRHRICVFSYFSTFLVRWPSAGCAQANVAGARVGCDFMYHDSGCTNGLIR